MSAVAPCRPSSTHADSGNGKGGRGNSNCPRCALTHTTAHFTRVCTFMHWNRISMQADRARLACIIRHSGRSSTHKPMHGKHLGQGLGKPSQVRVMTIMLHWRVDRAYPPPRKAATGAAAEATPHTPTPTRFPPRTYATKCQPPTVWTPPTPFVPLANRPSENFPCSFLKSRRHEPCLTH